MASIEGIATVASTIVNFLSAFPNFIIKKYNLSKNCIIKWYYRNDPIHQYKGSLKKKSPYHFNKLNELPREAQILFFRIYNTFRKRYSDKNITFPRYSNRPFTSLYFPGSSLIKDESIENIDVVMQILKHSGFIADSYDEDELSEINDQCVWYFHNLRKTSDISVKKGIFLIIPSQFGARCYLLAHGFETNTPCEKFSSIKISNSENLDTATHFYTEDDAKDLFCNRTQQNVYF